MGPTRTAGGLFLPDADALALVTGPAPAVPPFAKPVEPAGDGLRLPCGSASPYLVTDAERWQVELFDPELFVLDARAEVGALVPIAEGAAALARPFLVLAPAFSDDALALLVVNKLRGIVNVGALATERGGEVKAWLAGRQLARTCSGTTTTLFVAR